MPHPSPPTDDASRLVYNIPITLARAFPGQPVILRTPDPAEPPALLGRDIPATVLFIQITDPSPSMTPLADWGEGLPIDLVMADPAVELPLLYRCTSLLARHPVRVTVPWRPGLAGAVKLAVSLGFAARLAGHQPTSEALAEALRALDGYLHNPTVAQPVEPFHGLLLAFLHDAPVLLWSLMERDPAQLRVLDHQGRALANQGPISVAAFRDDLLAAGAECGECPWWAVCGGYYKWPDPAYACTGVKDLFALIRDAADELRRGLAAHGTGRGEAD